MAKDKMLYTAVAEVFDGYHPLAIFEKGTLYINYNTIPKPKIEGKMLALLELVTSGPECWGLKTIELGNKPEKIELESIWVPEIGHSCLIWKVVVYYGVWVCKLKLRVYHDILI